jgi:predicted  nucleic acid-binding Zn-ribbon protein
MSNQKISSLSGDKWSESTVKGYTKGVKATDPSPWQNAVALLDNLISTGMTLDDVDTAVTVFQDLKSHGITLTQVIELLLDVDSASMDLGTMVQKHKALKESGLSLKDVANVLALSKELEAKGLSLDSLPVLVKLASSYGEAQGVLEAFSVYGSLEQLKSEVKASKDELHNISQQTDSVKQKLEEAHAELSQLNEPLQSYHKALESGFGEQELDGLASLAAKFGGPKAVLHATKGYTNYLEIKNKVSEAKSELSDLESEINKLSVRHSHLTTAVSMCGTLITKYKFGLDAIATIFSIAGKYGEPLVVLKGVEAYGKLESIQHALTGLEGKIAERRKLLAELEGKREEALEHLESLNEMALKVGAAVAEVEAQLSNS